MTPRRSLSDVLHGHDREALAAAFEQTEAAGDLAPLPRGTYRCRITGGELVTSKAGTPGYSVTFTVDAGEYRGRRVWSTSWLTAAALPMAKRDLQRLGITSLDQLDRPLPPGMVADVAVVVRADDDGTERNHVRSFQVVAVVDDPTADDSFASPMPADNSGEPK